jgi:hypothetical protein
LLWASLKLVVLERGGLAANHACNSQSGLTHLCVDLLPIYLCREALLAWYTTEGYGCSDICHVN